MLPCYVLGVTWYSVFKGTFGLREAANKRNATRLVTWKAKNGYIFGYGMKNRRTGSPGKNNPPQTDDTGNAMIQSFLSKLFKKEIGRRYSRTVAKREKKMGLIYIICSRGCARRHLCFHVENCQHATQKSSPDDRPSITT